MNLVVRIAPTLLTLALFAATSWIVILSPPNGEDYALSSAASNQPFLDSAFSAANRSINQVRNWNARLGEQIGIFGLALPEWAQNLALVSSVALFAYLCARVARGLRPTFPLVGIAMAISLGALPRMELFFWRLINFAYLLPLCMFLILILLLGHRSRGVGRTAAIAFVSFLCGLSFENLPPAMGVFIVAHFLLATPKSREFVVSHLVAAASLLAGWVALMFAPSTTIRATYYRELFGYSPSFHYYAGRFGEVFLSFLTTSWVLLMIAAAASIHLAANKKWNSTLTAMSLAALSSVFIVAASPYTEPRAFAFAWATLLVIVLTAAANTSSQTVCLVSASALAFWPTIQMLKSYGEFRVAYERRHAELLRRSEKGACLDFEVAPIEIKIAKRLITLREDYVAQNIGHMRAHYGCTPE